MLRRIIARLVALAVVAERAAGRCWPVRLLILLLLRRAEAGIARFVLEETGTPPEVFEGMAAVGDGPADMLGLAARFRAVAAILAALLPDMCLLDRWPAMPAVACAAAAPGFGRLSGVRAPEPIDSS